MPRPTIDVGAGQALFDIVSFARRGPGRTTRLSPLLVAQVSRTVRRVPEVVVKISGGGTSAKGVVAHLNYLNRRREFEIETNDGKRVQGRGSVKNLVADWDLDLDASESQFGYCGAPGRKATRLVHNIVLSMPAGTSPTGLLAASQAFAREQFALKHRYAMVLHTDQPHPHVHLVVKAMSEQGERLHIRRATLREWRHEFAQHLRAQGIAANATDRVIRGVTKPRKWDGIYRANEDGRSTHTQRRQESVAAEILSGDIRTEPGKQGMLKTRQSVEQAWRAVSGALRSDGNPEAAAAVDRFVKEMSPPQTEREWIAAEVLGYVRPPPQRERAVAR
jgi:relaxase-like protein